MEVNSQFASLLKSGLSSFESQLAGQLQQQQQLYRNMLGAQSSFMGGLANAARPSPHPRFSWDGDFQHRGWTLSCDCGPVSGIFIFWLVKKKEAEPRQELQFEITREQVEDDPSGRTINELAKVYADHYISEYEARERAKMDFGDFIGYCTTTTNDTNSVIVDCSSSVQWLYQDYAKPYVDSLMNKPQSPNELWLDGEINRVRALAN